MQTLPTNHIRQPSPKLATFKNSSTEWASSKNVHYSRHPRLLQKRLK